ncbi:MAG TPA: TIGR02679 domain-containing protein, partial [Actinomycetes bacterium]
MTCAADDMDRARLRRLLGGDDLRWLIERARARLERGLPLEGIVALDRATEAQRRAIARLLGRPAGRGASLHVPLAAVDTVLRRGGLAPDLAA